MKPLGLYVHIPFCKRKCPYCDFYSVGVTENIQNFYTSAVKRELENFRDKLSDREIDSIYFGGGTPVLLSNKNFEHIVNAIYKNFSKSKDIEFTIEANPNIAFNYGKAKQLGVNRVSLGVQSFNDNELVLLGRQHTKSDIQQIVKQLQLNSIENISFDIMLGIQKQTMQSLKNSLDIALDLGAKHISAYMLKIEPNTLYYRNKEKLNLPDEDAVAELYLFTCEYLEANGLHQYEISNFAIDGYESRHNLKYWNCDEYLGIGPSAHSLIDNKRFFVQRNLKNFCKKAEYIKEDEEVDAIRDYIMLRLRLNEGITNKEYSAKFGKPIPEEYFTKAEKFKALGFVTADNNHIALTPKGFLISNIIISEII